MEVQVPSTEHSSGIMFNRHMVGGVTLVLGGSVRTTREGQPSTSWALKEAEQSPCPLPWPCCPSQPQ